MTQPRKKGAVSFNDIANAYEPQTQVVMVNGFDVTVRELTGRERFDAGAREFDSDWDRMLWLACTGIVDPVATTDELERIRPEDVKALCEAVMALSGMSVDAVDEAAKESGNVTDIGTS